MNNQVLNMTMSELLTTEQSCAVRLEELNSWAELETQTLMCVQDEIRERFELNEKVKQLNTLLSEVMFKLKSRNGALRFINTATGEVLTDLTADQFCETGDFTETVTADYVVGC